MSKFWQKKYISKHTGAEIDEAVEAVLDGDVGTKVVANPTLAGTEAALTGLQVDDTKYSVGGMTNPMTAAGDLIVGGTNGAPDKLVKGTDGKVLKMVSGAPAWADAGMTNPMTAAGDMIVGGADGAPDKLVKGTDGKVLKMISGAPAWADESGKTLYQHSINAYASYGTSSRIVFSTSIVNDSSTAFTSATFRNYCTAYPLSCSGMVVDDTSKVSSIIKVNYISSTSTWLFGGGMTIAPTPGTLDITTNYSVPSGTTFSFYDTVKQI